ncbi:MAG: SEL1-like repeat protein [Burkholderiales bacterium]|nr:SEL1-like repeat protein [Burkholderiales bacterium]
MSYFLGVAYQEGATVPRDATVAVRWFQQAASQGNQPAQQRLGTLASSRAAPVPQR